MALDEVCLNALIKFYDLSVYNYDFFKRFAKENKRMENNKVAKDKYQKSQRGDRLSIDSYQ